MSGTTTGLGTTGTSPSGLSASLQGSLDSNTIAQLVQQLLSATGASGTGGTTATAGVPVYQQPNVSNIVNPQNQYSTQAYSTLLQQILAMMRAGGQAGATGAGGAGGQTISGAAGNGSSSGASPTGSTS
jgi:hypothetical protein